MSSTKDRKKSHKDDDEKPSSNTLGRLMQVATLRRQRRTTAASSAMRTRERNERARSKHIESVLSVDSKHLNDALHVVITGPKGSGKVDLFSRICSTYPEHPMENSLQQNMPQLRPEMRAELTRQFLEESRELIERVRKLRLEEGEGEGEGEDSTLDFETIVQTLSSNLMAPQFISEDSHAVLKEAGVDDLVKEFKEKAKGKVKEHSFEPSVPFLNLLPVFLNEYPKWGGEDWKLGKRDLVNLTMFRAKNSVGSFSIDCEGTSITFSIDNQSSEAKRWFTLFDQVDAFIFVAACDEYNLSGKRGGCRQLDSIHEFFKKVNNEKLLKIPMFLVLGRTSSFDNKFRKQNIPLNVMRKFPGAPEEHRTLADTDAAIEFLKEKYMDKLSNVRRAEEGGAVSAVKMSDEINDAELNNLIHQLRLFKATQGVLNLNT